MKFALQVEDKDFEKAQELLGKSYDSKSNLLIFDPLTGEPPVGQFVLIAISDIWLQKYADRISGYINKLEDISGLVKTANYLETGVEEKIKSGSERAAEGSTGILPVEKAKDFSDISQDEEVKNFYLEPEKPILVEEEVKEENSNDFSFEFGEEKKEEWWGKAEEIKISKEKEVKEREVLLAPVVSVAPVQAPALTPKVEEIKISKEKEVKEGPVVSVAPVQAPALTPKVGEIKRIYLSNSDMAYTVGVGIHIKYSSKVIVIVDEELFQKYGESLDESVYIFKTFREATASSLQNYTLIITAEDKAQDGEILAYSKNPIAYWEEINDWAEKQK